jgi:hypothetical protein
VYVHVFLLVATVGYTGPTRVDGLAGTSWECQDISGFDPGITRLDFQDGDTVQVTLTAAFSRPKTRTERLTYEVKDDEVIIHPRKGDDKGQWIRLKGVPKGDKMKLDGTRRGRGGASSPSDPETDKPISINCFKKRSG